jgi:hypothetical protein
LERSQFETSPGKKVGETLSQPTKLDMMACACHPIYVGGINRTMVVQGNPTGKITKAKKAGSVARVVECLPSTRP